MDKMLEHIAKLMTLSDVAIEKILGIATLKHYKAGSILCPLGEKPSKIYFVVSGFVRGYSELPNGRSYNSAIFKENEFMASLTSLMRKEPNSVALECLTDAIIVESDYVKFIALTNKDPEVAQLYIKGLEQSFMSMERYSKELATLNATGRYLALRTRIPGIDNYISQHHIASHLGITPIQLSRIRKSLLNKS
jgi:CRP-like cAMP-binding protein